MPPFPNARFDLGKLRRTKHVAADFAPGAHVRFVRSFEGYASRGDIGVVEADQFGLGPHLVEGTAWVKVQVSAPTYKGSVIVNPRDLEFV
jgi:hypothetical protein